MAAFNTHIGVNQGFVDTQYDQIGADNMITASNPRQPELLPIAGNDGNPAMDYDGANCLMEQSSIAGELSGNDLPYTMLTVVKPRNVASVDAIWAFARTSDNDPLIMNRVRSVESQEHFRRDDGGTSDVDLQGGVTDDNYFVLGIMFDGSQVFMLNNGVLITPSNTNVGTMTFNRFAIGAILRSGFVNPFDGHIDEFVMWNQSIGRADFLQASYNMSQFYAVY